VAAYEAMNSTFSDDLRHAHEITVEAFHVRSWLRRMVERGLRLAPLL